MPGRGHIPPETDTAWTPSRRALFEAERRAIQSKIRSVTRSGRRATSSAFPITGAIVLVLWLLTLAATSAPWYIVTGFWLVIGSVIGWMAWRDLRKDQAHLDSYGARLASALKRDAADVYDVRAVAFVEFEEFEDEGATYGFDLGDGRIAFIQGQEFYEGARFPSLDFSLVYALDESGQPADMLIAKRGERARPARIISADAKHPLEIPDHLAIRLGKLDDIEATLRPRR